jgi:hypothetical protein
MKPVYVPRHAIHVFRQFVRVILPPRGKIVQSLKLRLHLPRPRWIIRRSLSAVGHHIANDVTSAYSSVRLRRFLTLYPAGHPLALDDVVGDPCVHVPP